MDILKLDNIDFRYSAGFRMSGLTLEIEAGSMTGLVGPNGSGKSTVLRLMSGLLAPERGQVLLEGKPLGRYSRLELARRMAMVSHERTFEFPFTVRDVVGMGRFPHSSGGEANDRGIIDEALERTGTAELAVRPITQLSSGERQLVLIARAIAQQPSLMLLDEPDAHLDIHHQLRVYRLLAQLNQDRRMTILLVSHDLSATASFCGRVVLISQGTVLKAGTPHEVLAPEYLEQVYGDEVRVTQNPLDGAPLVVLTADPLAGRLSKGLPRDPQT